ncbi:hypothetical protein HDU91_007305 [Kappamyces sp. JEL0680]|nr:hypothetical protein HDU91_007305 [Kappamyces sp. JEL0680]
MTQELTALPQYQDLLSKYDTFLFDCDGVIWQGNTLIADVEKVLFGLQAAKKRILFVTNNASKSRETYVKKFASFGIEVEEDQVFGSAYCAAFYIKNKLDFPPEKKVYICGMRGISDELDAMAIKWCGGPNDNQRLHDMGNLGDLELDQDVGAVLVGFDIDINYKKIAKAYTYLKNPETVFLATNDDLTYPSDIAFGKMGSVGTLLVLTGVTSRELLAGSPIQPEYVVESLGSLHIIMFSDLECDYINPIDLCSKLNQFVIPDHALHGLLWVLFLLNGCWVDMLLNTPLLLWHAHKIYSGTHKYDATEIFRTITSQKRESFVKLGFYLICFFFYLYRMIESLVSGK